MDVRKEHFQELRQPVPRDQFCRIDVARVVLPTTPDMSTSLHRLLTLKQQFASSLLVADLLSEPISTGWVPLGAIGSKCKRVS